MNLKDCSICALQHLPSFTQHNDLRSSPIVACINSSFQFIDKSIPYTDLPSLCIHLGFPHSSVGKESTCNAGDPGLIPGLGRSPGEGIGYPLQSGLENPMDCVVHEVAKSKQLSLHFTSCIHLPSDGCGLFPNLANIIKAIVNNWAQVFVQMYNFILHVHHHCTFTPVTPDVGQHLVIVVSL